ncbi:MAG TPA: hypothetical protein VGM39_15210 [Kofleriaceae bacterium]
MKRCLVLASLLVPSIALGQPADPPASSDEPTLPEAPIASPPADTSPSESPTPAPVPEPAVDPANHTGRRLNGLPCGNVVRSRNRNFDPQWPELDQDRCRETRPAFPVWNPNAAIDLELVTQGRYTVKDGDNLSEIKLDRGEVGVRLPIGGWLSAQFRAETLRSAQDGGALGIGGDSTVVRVKYANVIVHGEVSGFDIEGGAGFIADPWIQSLETSYSLKPLSRTGSERLLGWQTADLAAMGRVAYGPARLTVNIGNGEGQSYPERNNGKTTTGVVEVVALHNSDARVTLMGMGRDGSVGPSRIRDRRAGGGATAVFDVARVGFEIVRAWGIADNGAAKGTEVGAWAEANVAHKLFVGARGSTLGYSAGGRSSTFGGAISYGDSFKDAGNARVWLAVDRITNSGDAMPLVGADSGDQTVIMLMLSGDATYAPKGD